MELVKNMERAIDNWQNHDYNASLNFATLAIEATARRYYNKSHITRTEYIKLIRKYYWVIEIFMGFPADTAYRFYSQIHITDDRGKNIGGRFGPDLADIIYHVFRCSIHHGCDLPIKYKLVPTSGVSSVSIIGQDPQNDVLLLPTTVIIGILAICLVCSANYGLGLDSTYYLTLDTSVCLSSQSHCINDELIFNQLVCRGAVLKFDFCKYFGREDEIKNILSSVPRQPATSEKIQIPGGTYKMSYDIKYL